MVALNTPREFQPAPWTRHIDGPDTSFLLKHWAPRPNEPVTTFINRHRPPGAPEVSGGPRFRVWSESEGPQPPYQDHLNWEAGDWTATVFQHDDSPRLLWSHRPNTKASSPSVRPNPGRRTVPDWDPNNGEPVIDFINRRRPLEAPEISGEPIIDADDVSNILWSADGWVVVMHRGADYAPAPEWAVSWFPTTPPDAAARYWRLFPYESLHQGVYPEPF